MSALHRDTEHLLALADRCEAGAAQLAYEADHAAEVLAGRAGGDRIDPAAWAAQQQGAAEAARQYAAELRTQVEAMGEYERPSAEQLAQAESVADAANLGGILIDGRRQAEATAAGANALHGEADRDAWEAGTHPAQTKAQAVEGSGQFTHVAETIDGVEQVPYWQLGHTDQPTASSEAVASSEPVDEA